MCSADFTRVNGSTSQFAFRKLLLRIKEAVRLKELFFVDFHLCLKYLAKISFNPKMTQLSYSP